MSNNPVGKSGTPRHAGHVSPIIYESITYLPNFWSTRPEIVRSAPYITQPNYKYIIVRGVLGRDAVSIILRFYSSRALLEFNLI